MNKREDQLTTYNNSAISSVGYTVSPKVLHDILHISGRINPNERKAAAILIRTLCAEVDELKTLLAKETHD